MRKMIPSLGALEIFECVARHENLTRAAEELHLTQSAVSKQMIGLEHKLGVVLFRRVKKRIELTHYGQNYAMKIRSCLERIERTTSDLIVQREEGSSLDIAIGATFATQWLIPKLKDFRSKYSKININLTVKSDPFVLNNSQFDAVIYYGDDVWRDTAGELLLREGKVVPICSRELINDIPDVSAEIIAQFPLLHLSSREDAWKQWFATAGLADDLRPLRGSRFELFTMLTSAAMSGLGVALVPEIFVLTELANNQLVIPVSHHLPNDQGYYISYNDDPINKEALEVFGYWLRGRCNEAA
ncbi:MAG: LysR family transcriptional regulator [Candidimonas sp.]|nr:MAG: LysR family transcriptional regulator [Candidimonas sp.]